MQDDQQISQSVDNLISQTPDDGTPQDQASPAYSLGSNPTQQTQVAGSGQIVEPTNNQSTNSTQDSGQLDVSGQDQTQTIQPQTSAPLADDPDNPQTSGSGVDSGLQEIKQQALNQLSPIVSELDQTPEEKYRTIMMLIQASDDQSLIKSAYDAANNIDDKKARAEALLNIVNEINYFSGQGENPQQQ